MLCASHATTRAYPRDVQNEITTQAQAPCLSDDLPQSRTGWPSRFGREHRTAIEEVKAQQKSIARKTRPHDDFMQFVGAGQ